MSRGIGGEGGAVGGRDPNAGGGSRSGGGSGAGGERRVRGGGGAYGGRVGPNGRPSNGSPDGFGGLGAGSRGIGGEGGARGGRDPNAGRGVEHMGEAGKSPIADAVMGALNPTGDPVLSTGLKIAMGPVAPVMAAVGALQALGVPSSPANTSPAYQDAAARQAGGYGQNEAQWLIDDGGVQAAPPVDEVDPTIPGNVYTTGGVTGTRLPVTGPSPLPPVTDEPVVDQGPIDPLTTVVRSTTPASPLAKVVKSALGGNSAQRMVA